MQAILSRLGQLDPDFAVLLVFVGLIYGLFGWRVVRYLAFADAFIVALVVAFALPESAGKTLFPFPTLPISVILLIGVPWLAWRYSRFSIALMCGVVGFLIVQILLLSYDAPLIARVCIGAIGAAFAMAMRMTLNKETAIVVTGLHGGWLCMAALAVLASYPESFLGRMFNTLYHMNALLIPLVAACLSAILIAVQWADMERDTDPIYCRH